MYIDFGNIMKLTEILREIIKEELLGGDLYFYHVTTKSAIDSIRKNGLRVADRTMEGNGVYGFVDYDNSKQYAYKDIKTNETVIATFKINYYHTKELLYLDLDLAKKVLGEQNYHLKDQLENYFKSFGGLNYLHNWYNKNIKKPIGFTEYIAFLDNLESKNTREITTFILFNMIPSVFNDKINAVYQGEYGLQIRINTLRYIDSMIKYIVLTDRKGGTSEHFPSLLDDIPETEEFEPLRNFFDENRRFLNSKPEKIVNTLQDLQRNVKNIREYNYYDQIINLLNKLKEMS